MMMMMMMSNQRSSSDTFNEGSKIYLDACLVLNAGVSLHNQRFSQLLMSVYVLWLQAYSKCYYICTRRTGSIDQSINQSINQNKFVQCYMSQANRKRLQVQEDFTPQPGRAGF